MTLFYSEELRLLLEICILLLKVNRRTISAKELKEFDSIAEKTFGLIRASDRLGFSDKTIGLQESLAIANVSIKDKVIVNSITLKYPLWYYEEMLQEITTNKEVFENRELYWEPFYKEAEAKKEVIKNSSSYKGKRIRGKQIFGIGNKSICLIDENENKSFHWFVLPKHLLFKENTHSDGFDLAKEIIQEHASIGYEKHLIYLTHPEDELNEIAKIEAKIDTN